MEKRNVRKYSKELKRRVIIKALIKIEEGMSISNSIKTIRNEKEYRYIPFGTMKTWVYSYIRDKKKLKERIEESRKANIEKEESITTSTFKHFYTATKFHTEPKKGDVSREKEEEIKPFYIKIKEAVIGLVEKLGDLLCKPF